LASLLSSDKNINFDGNYSPLKTSLFLLVCIAWLLPGLTGHTPWKYDEAVSQGIVHGMLHGGSWLSPTLAGEPYFAHPPLYYWVAACFARWFGEFIPVHDAARLASGFFMALTMVGVALGAHALWGARAMRVAVIVLIGSVGLLLRAHEMSTDLSFLAGVTLTLAAIPLARSQSMIAGALGGLGLGIAFLSQGTLALGLLFPLTVLAPVLISDYWPKHPLRYAFFWVLCALPFFVLWPVALYLQSPELFSQWWRILVQPTLHPNHWLAEDMNPTYYLGVAAWFAWPATPLALWALWESLRRGFANAAVRFLILVLVEMFLVLGFSTHPHESGALPLLIPLSLLAAGSIDSLRRGATSALDWFGMLTFGMVTLLLWLGWIAQLTGSPVGIVHYLDAQLPGYHATFQPVAFGASLLLTLLWIIAILNSRQSSRRALVNWTVGMTLSWLLAMTLWLPYIEASRSYKDMMQSLGRAIPAQHGCVASTGLGEAQRALLDYYLNIRTQRIENDLGKTCRLWLVQSRPRDAFEVPQGWRLLWTGARAGDKSERFQLFGY